MKKLIKRFWWIILVLVAAGSITFNIKTVSDNRDLEAQIKIVQQENEDLKKYKDELEAYVQSLETDNTNKDLEIKKLQDEITNLKKN